MGHMVLNGEVIANLPKFPVNTLIMHSGMAD